jgi:outer membrane protein TolC
MIIAILNKIKQVLLITSVGAMGSPVEAGALLDLYQQTLDSNPSLLSRKYTIDQAEARQDQAFSRLLPQVSATGSYSGNSFKNDGFPTENYDGLRGTVQARQALLDAPSYLRYLGSEAATHQSQEEYEAFQMELGGDTHQR